MLLFKEMMLLNQCSIFNAQNSITSTPSKTNSEAIVRMSIVIMYWFLSDEQWKIVRRILNIFFIDTQKILKEPGEINIAV